MDEASAEKNIDELLLEYVGLKAQVRALQHEMAAIYPDVLAALRSTDSKREVGGAIVSVHSRKTYKYSDQVNWISDEIKERKEALKQRKKEEVDTGIAEVESVTESVFVRFKKAES